MKIKRLHLPVGIDWALLTAPILLSIFGLVIIFSVTFTTKPLLVFSQAVYAGLGLICALALTFFDYRNLRSFSLFLYLLNLLLLILVLVLGSHTFGAVRWIDFKFFQLQPSELLKLVIILLLARIFAENHQDFRWKHLFLVGAILLVPIFLVLKQPDFGTAIVVVWGVLSLFFFSGIKKTILIFIVAAIILTVPIGWHFLRDYQKQRIYTFINPATDRYGTGYNVTQAKITVGSGGLWGQGIGQGTQIQLNFLPVAHSDFIFASTAESVGFVGSSFLCLLLLFFIYRVLNVARAAKDRYGFYFAISWGMMLVFQIFVNIGMNLGIMPVTGIPLPFVSYGGSSMLVNFAALGILESIYLRHRKISF